MHVDLFSPIRIGAMSLNSRLVVLPHVTAMTRHGKITEEEVAHWSSLAGPNVGMVITGAAAVGPSSVMRHVPVLEAWREENSPGLRRLADAVHAKGSRLIGQLYHNGREQMAGEALTVSVAPSPVRTKRDFYVPHVLEENEIQEIIQDFARSARNYQMSGYDGIELHAAHGYLISQFLSPRTNHRTDGWGGTPEKRLRLLLEIIDAVRGACKADFAVGIRISGEEENEGGLTINDSAKIARRLEETGGIDYLSISTATRGKYVKDISVPEAPLADAARTIRDACELPIILGQRIPNPKLAETLLEDGYADLIGMARPFLADPEFAEKAASGKQKKIRPCIAINQDCRMMAPHIHCAVNPQTGRETLPGFGPIEKAEHPKSVAVVGAGPAGLEAARVAALRGHSVTLFEATDKVGGQFNAAASLPSRAGLIRIIEHLHDHVRALGVDLKLSTKVGCDDGALANVDSVIIATGAVPLKDCPLLGNPNVICWSDIVDQGVPSLRGSGRAAVADDGSGSWFSYGIANALTDAGWEVDFVTPSGTVGFGVPVESVPPLLGRLANGPTHFHVLASVSGYDGEIAMVRDVISGADREMPCDLLVVQTGRAATPLDVSAQFPDSTNVTMVGDCVAPRRISHAILEGYKAGRQI